MQAPEAAQRIIAEVQKLEHIDGPGSRVLHDRLELITVDKSVACGAVRRDAPFDVTPYAELVTRHFLRGKLGPTPAPALEPDV